MAYRQAIDEAVAAPGDARPTYVMVVGALAALLLPRSFRLAAALILLAAPARLAGPVPVSVAGGILTVELLHALPGTAWALKDRVEGSIASLFGAPVVGVSVWASVATLAIVFGAGMAPRRAGIAVAAHVALAALASWAAYSGAAFRVTETAALAGVLTVRACSWAIDATLLLHSGSPHPRRLEWHRRVALGFAAAAIVMSWPPRLPSGHASPIRTTFLWPETPQEEFADANAGLGFTRIGLYGEWPRVLARAGLTVTKEPKLTNDVLARTDVVIVPSLYRRWHDDERDTFLGWLRSGGRAVFVGEHSDLENCSRWLNPLLTQMGIHLNFDTTNGLLGDGLRGVFFTGPLGTVLRRYPDLPYNRGGSLSVSDSAAPALIGGSWHADGGDPLAPERAFLSDYRISTDDRVGDVILLATTESGRVIVAGDSTPFLNQNILYSSGFLIELPALLMSARSERQRGLFAAMVGIGSVVLLVLVPGATRYGAATLLCAIAIPWVYDKPVHRSEERVGIVSTGEENAVDRDPFSPRSATALALSYQRADLTPILGEWRALRERPKVVAILNPGVPLSTEDARLLERWATQGTTVLLSGQGDHDPFRRTAALFGVEVTARVIGSRRGESFTVYEGWQVASLPNGARPLEAAGFLVGGVLPRGSGKLVIVADGWFFLSKNLEMETTFDEGNIAFVAGLLQP